jgi:diguanylate cyclase (GGDEF)-like protein
VELRNYIRVILRGWWLVLSALLISVASGLVFTYSQTPIYRSTATFVVSPSSSLGQFNDFMRSLDSLSKRDGVMATYVEIAQSNTILNVVYKEMELTQAQLEYLDVSSELIPSTNIIKITVESDDPLIAKTVADLVGQKSIEYVGNLYEAYDMKPLDPANTPRSPSKPQKAQNLLVAAILGLAVGVGSAFLLENLRSSDEILAGVSIIDGDTGIYNRYYFLQRLGEELSRAKRSRSPLSLALMNVERLDAIGDMRLPRLRNEALRRVALFLKQYMRGEDMVARFEGDKLALLLPDTSSSDAKQILEYLQTRLAWNIFDLEASGMKLNLTATCGIATYCFNGTGRDELISNAENALRRASDNSYSKVCIFDDDGNGMAEEEMDANRYEPTTGE